MSWYAQRGSQRTTHNEALNAFFRLHSGLCFSYLASRQPPIQLDPFSLPRYLTPFLIPVPPPAVVVVWYYHILCNSKRLKYCYCCLAKEQAGWGPEVFDRNNAWLHTMDAKSNQEQKREEKFTFLFEWQTSSDRFELVYQQSATFGGTIVMPFLEFFRHCALINARYVLVKPGLT